MKKGFTLWLIVATVIVGSAVFYGTSNKESTPVQQQVQQIEKSQKEILSTPMFSNATTEFAEKQPVQKLTNYRCEDIINVHQISKDLIGKTVVIVAKISNINLNKSSNTAFFDVKDVNSNIKIKGVIFNKTMNDNPGRLELLQSAANSDRQIYIEGEIDIYKGSLEIKAWKIFTEDDLN